MCLFANEEPDFLCVYKTSPTFEQIQSCFKDQNLSQHINTSHSRMLVRIFPSGEKDYIVTILNKNILGEQTIGRSEVPGTGIATLNVDKYATIDIKYKDGGKTPTVRFVENHYQFLQKPQCTQLPHSEP